MEYCTLLRQDVNHVFFRSSVDGPSRQGWSESRPVSDGRNGRGVRPWPDIHVFGRMTALSRGTVRGDGHATDAAWLGSRAVHLCRRRGRIACRTANLEFHADLICANVTFRWIGRSLMKSRYGVSRNCAQRADGTTVCSLTPPKPTFGNTGRQARNNRLLIESAATQHARMTAKAIPSEFDDVASFLSLRKMVSRREFR